MKKISYLELSTIIITILTSFNLGINLNILKNNTGIDSWLTIILSYLIGLIPLIVTIYISNYKPHLNIFEKNNTLFNKTVSTVINTIIVIILFIIAITLLYNIISFISTQFLYHTPMIISAILLVSLAIYSTTKGINVLSHVSFILITINLIIFTISTTSLIKEINLENLLPLLITPPQNILTTAIKISIINIIPLLIILIIPKNNITNQKKYTITIIISYIISMLISFIIITGTISTLDIYLTKTYEYAEYIVLKKIKLFGFLERIENVSSIQWITETYIYITLIIYTITKSITSQKEKNKAKKIFNYTSILIGILLIIINNYFFTSISMFNNYIQNTLIYIISILIPIYIIIFITIRKKNNTIKQ